RLAKATVSRNEQPSLLYQPVIASLAVLVLGGAISYGAIEGEPMQAAQLNSGLHVESPDAEIGAWLRAYIPKLLSSLPIYAPAFANLDEEDVSGRASGAIALKPARMGGVDLRYASAKGAYLRGAFMRKANLRGSNLVAADLREADL